MGGWAKQISRQHKEHMKQIKENRDKMKSHRDARETSVAPGLQMRRMKLTAEEKRRLKTKILESYDQRPGKGTWRK